MTSTVDTAPTSVISKNILPVLGNEPDLSDIEAELAAFEAAERERLGLETTEHWVEHMANLSFTKAERGDVTLLISGLTMAHDYLLQAALGSAGYNVLALDCPDNDAFRAGKEFGNRGQCNPTYFTVGNLVKFLIHLRDEKGMSTEEIIKKYVFLTAGACGPCRFGMYVTEFRKALRDAGFDGFRVMLFQQQGGLNQATGDEEEGLELTPAFFIPLLKALLVGDVLNGIGYRLRPYELEEGATDRALEQAKRMSFEAFKQGQSQLLTLWKARKLFEAIPVDRTMPKPKVAIIGEFWAMTTEGDGNYELQRFLEREGAECDIQFVTAWLLYNIWEVSFDVANRATLRGQDSAAKGLAGKDELYAFKMKVLLWAADKALRVVFQTFAKTAGFHGYKLPDMDEIARVAAPYYNNDLRGGEGHMEVGKLIMNVVHQKATMTLSVKPFGCMPSSAVSDGVQSLIAEQFPGTIYCPVETSGDGAVNFYSRVQMYLFKAKQAVENEVTKALEEKGLTREAVQSYVAKHPRLRNPLYAPAHFGSATAVDMVYEVAERVNETPWERAKSRARRLLGQAHRAALETPSAVKGAAALTKQGAGELVSLGVERARERLRKSA